MLFHAPLSIRNCCAVLFLFLYATVTSRSPLCTRLLYCIVPVCHCYITFPSLYETAVSYCSCVPLLHHVPHTLRNCCAILFLYATVASRPPLYTKPLCRIVPVPVCHCYITPPSLYETAVPYCSCSCMPLLHHAPLYIRNCSVILIALLFAVHSLQRLW